MEQCLFFMDGECDTKCVCLIYLNVFWLNRDIKCQNRDIGYKNIENGCKI